MRVLDQNILHILTSKLFRSNVLVFLLGRLIVLTRHHLFSGYQHYLREHHRNLREYHLYLWSTIATFGSTTSNFGAPSLPSGAPSLPGESYLWSTISTSRAPSLPSGVPLSILYPLILLLDLDVVGRYHLGQE